MDWPVGRSRHFVDIAISYRYVPDDSVERECRKEWYSMPAAEAVRRMQSPNDGLTAFVARCRTERDPSSRRK
jgi:hypothetical protein